MEKGKHPIDEFQVKPRADQELKDAIQEVLHEWEIDDYYVMIHGLSGASIYPMEKILEVGHEQLRWPMPAVVSTLLHEIGHIDRGHCLNEHDDWLLNYVDEYEADEFAFDAVQTRYGYVPNSAGLWLLSKCGTWAWENGTMSHPSHRDRWKRLALNGLVPDNYHPILQALGLSEDK